MKIYLDACCLNRPFDDQSQNRVRLESEAILIILDRLHDEWEWVGSEALVIELENTPDIEKRNYLIELSAGVHTNVKIEENEIERANDLINMGFKPYDAMHISCSESVNTDVFLTTDDKLLKIAERNKDEINVRIANPLSWVMEIIS